jgi:CubicO group peptidase (beta-lactamase class C family)
MIKRLILLVLFSFTAVGTVAAAELPRAAPEEMGFSAEKLEELKAHFSKYVEDGKVAGLTTLVSRRGKIVHFHSYGAEDKAAQKPMKADTVFRIYSMTKPVTGVAMMMLWEDGKYQLDDPISKYLPEYADAQVFAGAGEDGKVNTRPVEREATIRDLMRHTAGLTYGFFGDTPVDRLYRASGMFDPKHDLKTLSKLLAKQPLLYQPGEAWVYSLATDVQGQLVEVLSGMSLDAFFKTRIFDPLGMTDTGFQVRADQKDRFAEIYGFEQDGSLTPYRGDMFVDFTKKPVFLSGGGGLVSTTSDYWRFAQMLANGGELDGARILKAETVALMAQDHLPKQLKGIAGGKQGLGFGLNFAVVKDVQKSSAGFGRKGEFFWGGMANTLFWVDPEEEIVALLMVNVLPSGVLPFRNDMRRLVYSALEE